MVLGSTALSTVKGGDADLKDIMLIKCNYFYPNKDDVEIEFGRLQNNMKLFERHWWSQKRVVLLNNIDN